MDAVSAVASKGGRQRRCDGPDWADLEESAAAAGSAGMRNVWNWVRLKANGTKRVKPHGVGGMG